MFATIITTVVMMSVWFALSFMGQKYSDFKVLSRLSRPTRSPRLVPDVAWGVSHLEPLELMDVEDWELIQSSYLGSSSWSPGWSCDEQVENLLSW